MTDRTGNRIRPGDRIAYALRCGSDVWLDIYEVLELWSDGAGNETEMLCLKVDASRSWQATGEDARPVTLLHPERAVVLA